MAPDNDQQRIDDPDTGEEQRPRSPATPVVDESGSVDGVAHNDKPDRKAHQENEERDSGDSSGRKTPDIGTILGGGGYAGISAGDVVTSATGDTAAGGDTPSHGTDERIDR